MQDRVAVRIVLAGLVILVCQALGHRLLVSCTPERNPKNLDILPGLKTGDSRASPGG
jgi:hypothetical protein